METWGETRSCDNTPNGTPVVNFSVAVGRQWTTSTGERREATDWFNVVAWRELAEICNQMLSKGRRVYIEGSLQTRSWEDEKGQRHYRVELVADQMILLDRYPAREREWAAESRNNV
ncbi:MAG: single-stranded DNA-binding protein [Ardenticatenia bacterium]|nr:single-stranded DNA-binding protein [Ardenticatenia bacterium]